MKMKFVLSITTLFIIISLTFSACQIATPKTDVEVFTTRLTLGYIPNIQFTPIYVAIEKGYFNEAGFDVQLDYGNEADAIALIGAGEQTFSIASGEQILLARAQGLPVTFVASWYSEYPVGVVSLKEEDIKTPQDLVGKTVGLPGLYGASYIGFIALLNAGGLTENDISMQSIGFNQVEAVATHQVQSAVIYLANEPVVLASQGYDINVIRLADYKHLVSNGLVTSEKMVKTQPEKVTAFIDAMLKGLDDTVKNPDEAFEISKKYVENLADLDVDLQHKILAESISLWQTDPLGYTDPAGWENMQDVLLLMGLVTDPQDLDKAFTNELLP